MAMDLRQAAIIFQQAGSHLNWFQIKYDTIIITWKHAKILSNYIVVVILQHYMHAPYSNRHK